MAHTLPQLRTQIDALDRELLALLNQRIAIDVGGAAPGGALGEESSLLSILGGSMDGAAVNHVLKVRQCFARTVRPR